MNLKQIHMNMGKNYTNLEGDDMNKGFVHMNLGGNHMDPLMNEMELKIDYIFEVSIQMFR